MGFGMASELVRAEESDRAGRFPGRWARASAHPRVAATNRFRGVLAYALIETGLRMLVSGEPKGVPARRFFA